MHDAGYVVIYRANDGTYQTIDEIYNEDSAHMVLAMTIMAGYKDARIESKYPIKTRKDDFLEKFPNASLNHHGYPITCAGYVYGFYNGGGCLGSCENCWDMGIT